MDGRHRFWSMSLGPGLLLQSSLSLSLSQHTLRTEILIVVVSPSLSRSYPSLWHHKWRPILAPIAELAKSSSLIVPEGVRLRLGGVLQVNRYTEGCVIGFRLILMLQFIT